MSSDFEIERRCAHEKKPGIIQLSPTHIVWTPDSAADGAEVRISFTSIRQFQVSKEGSAKKAMIRLTSTDRDNKVTFDFGRNFTDRDSIRDVLNKLQARGNEAAPAVAPAALSQPLKPAVALSSEERARRQKLLGRKEVRRLHGRLVRSGAVTDETFWNAMKFRYKANGERKVVKGMMVVDEEDEAVQRECVQGVPSDAYTSERVDPRGWENGVPNAGQRHMVFMQEGAVRRAYEAKVGELGKKKFWEYYLGSSYAGRRGGMSKAESVRTAEADGLFAAFQTGEMEQERKEREERIEGLARGIDLDRFDDHRMAHVLEGREGERERGKVGVVTENTKLVQRLNRHGSMIVTGGGWEEGDEVKKGRPLDDLEVDEGEKFAELGVEEGKSGGGGVRAGGGRSGGMMRIGEGLVEEWGMLDVGRFRGDVGGSGEVLRDLVGRMRPV
eukprot:GFKZ01010949.1.p1 GENE.GFKZ01010949.1~~GFKZ01010949.1.p1  ORF type:complete len:443 (-),score=90.20 GFKZ01010949.1:929-2257(-)